jgi:hypothetical protein
MRAGIAALVLVVVACCAVGWPLAGRDRTSIAGIARFAEVTFGLAVAIQCFTLLVVLEETAQVLPRERNRRTLDGLLTSGLSSTGIVLGLFAAGLVKSAVFLAAGLPVLLLMVPVLGIDPRLVLLAYAGLGTTALALVALALAASTGARTSRDAATGAALLLVVWFFLPLLLVLVLPILWRAGSAWVVPVAVWVLDTSPMAVLATVLGVCPRGALVTVVLRMIASELAIGLVLLAWAIVRLRPVSRALADAESRAGVFRYRRSRLPRRRPPCGADAMLWKELHATRGLGLRDILVLIEFGCIGLCSLYFAPYAWLELIARGYGTSVGESSPSSAWEWAFVLARNIPLNVGQARAVFNLVLREFTMVCGLILALVATEATGLGIAQERDQDTWPGLLATPLTPWEILRAKMIGVLWRLRWPLGLLVGYWTLGLVVGSLHPLGFLAGLLVLSVSTGFVVVLGTTYAIRTSDPRQGRGSCIFLVFLLTFSGLLPRVLPHGVASVLLGAGSSPLLFWLALVSYHDVDSAVRTGSYPQLELLAFDTGEGALSVLATCLIGLIGQALAAVLLTRAALRRFDAAAGRL